MIIFDDKVILLYKSGRKGNYRIIFIDGVIEMINEIKYGRIHWKIDNKEKYKEFETIAEAYDWGMKHYSSWTRRYKSIMGLAEKVLKDRLCTSPLEDYCGNLYRQINEFLRYGTDDECNTYRELAHVLSFVLCSAPKIPCDLILYRLVNDEFIKHLIENNKKKREEPMQEKGFMSTSLTKNIVYAGEAYAKENNLLKIFVPKETMGVYVNGVTKRSEEEMLLVPNRYLALVTYPYKDKETGKTIYECRLINYID